MAKYRLIGDVHGKYKRYKKIIAERPNTIQVGDMGVGFRRTQGYRAGSFCENPPHYAMLAGNHRFIRGNHDNPSECSRHSQWIADGTVENDIMFVGGADSIDKEWRIKDYSWWENEELSREDFKRIREVYKFARPRVMITHTAPTEATTYMLDQVLRQVRLGPSTVSEDEFQQLLQIHRPELWVFGHWHHHLDVSIDGTHYVCLEELEYRDDLV
jgi:hypothetical protein